MTTANFNHAQDVTDCVAQEKLASKRATQLKMAILGPDGAGKSSVIAGLMTRLNQGGHAVNMRHLKPSFAAFLRGQSVTIVIDPHGKPPRSALLSLGKILVWLAEEWYASVFWGKTGTLLICDRYYHDLLVDPKRYRYGGPLWAAALVGKLIPEPRLWILLDAPAEVLQSRKREVSPEETARQRDAYLKFVRGRRDYVIVDASQPLEQVIADVECAITMAATESEADGR